MSARRRTLAVACGALAAALLAPAAGAAAAGAPVPSAQSGRVGAVSPGGNERFLTRRAGAGTLVIATRRNGGQVLRSRTISGRWTIPAVTINGATTGLSADGRTLVLVRPVRKYPPQTTPLAVVDARTVSVKRRIHFKGFFTVDAISPDGRWAYVIQYASDDPFDYRVRALDLGSGKLAARDVVDPRKPDEQMGGLPMTRLTSPDGRWAYTLYGGGSETFIHALDTVGRTAACIDLEMLPTESDLSTVRLRLSADGRHLLVRDGGELVATVDRRTFAVTEPVREPAPAPAAPVTAASGGGDGVPWLIVTLGAACLAVIGVTFARRRGRGFGLMHRPEG